MYFIYLQGSNSYCNTIWASILKQLPHIPEGYKWHHLKWQVIVNTVTKREELYDELKPHVNKCNFSYRELCEHFANARGETKMLPGAGDFIIFATRL